MNSTRLIIAFTFTTLLILSFLFGFMSYRNQNLAYRLIAKVYYFFELQKPTLNKQDFQEIKTLLNDKEFIDYQILYAREIYDFVKKDPLSFRKEILKKAIIPKEIVTIKKSELKKNYEFQNLIPKDAFKSLDNKFLINAKYYDINHFGILEIENNNKLFIFNGGQGPSRIPLKYEDFLKLKEELKKYINPLILKIKIIFVTTVFFTTCIAFTILTFGAPSTAFKHILEWNYFCFLLFYYLLSRLLWKKDKT